MSDISNRDKALQSWVRLYKKSGISKTARQRNVVSDKPLVPSGTNAPTAPPKPPAVTTVNKPVSRQKPAAVPTGGYTRSTRQANVKMNKDRAISYRVSGETQAGARTRQLTAQGNMNNASYDQWVTGRRRRLGQKVPTGQVSDVASPFVDPKTLAPPSQVAQGSRGFKPTQIVRRVDKAFDTATGLKGDQPGLTSSELNFANTVQRNQRNAFKEYANNSSADSSAFLPKERDLARKRALRRDQIGVETGLGLNRSAKAIARDRQGVINVLQQQAKNYNQLGLDQTVANLALGARNAFAGATQKLREAFTPSEVNQKANAGETVPVTPPQSISQRSSQLRGVQPAAGTVASTLSTGIQPRGSTSGPVPIPEIKPVQVEGRGGLPERVETPVNIPTLSPTQDQTPRQPTQAQIRANYFSPGSELRKFLSGGADGTISRTMRENLLLAAEENPTLVEGLPSRERAALTALMRNRSATQ